MKQKAHGLLLLLLLVVTFYSSLKSHAMGWGDKYSGPSNNDVGFSQSSSSTPPRVADSRDTGTSELSQPVSLPSIKLIGQSLGASYENALSYQLDSRCMAPDQMSIFSDSGFDAILSRAKAKRPRRACARELETIACQESPWRKLDLENRFKRILEIGKEYADKYDVDVRSMPCLAGAETTFLDPLRKVTTACYHRKSSAQGLGQMTRSTLYDHIRSRGFKSSIPPFDRPPYVGTDPKSMEKLFNAMANSVPLQLEIMAFTLKEKARIDSRNREYMMFYRYIGHPRRSVSNAYAKANHSCLQCLRSRIDENGRPITVGGKDPLECLSHVARRGSRLHGKPDRQIHKNFESRQRFCRSTDNPEKPYQPVCTPRQ